MYNSIFLKDLKFSIDAPLQTDKNKIKYSVKWNHQEPNTNQTFNLQYVVRDILLGITLKQNDQLDLKMDFGKMNIENVGILRPKFTYSFNKFIEASNLQMNLGLKRNQNSLSLKLNDRLKGGLFLNTKVKRMLNPFTLSWTTETKFKEYFRHGFMLNYKKEGCPCSFSIKQQFVDYYVPSKLNSKLKYKANEKVVLQAQGSVSKDQEKKIQLISSQNVNSWLKVKERINNKGLGGGIKLKFNDEQDLNLQKQFKSIQVKISSQYKWSKGQQNKEFGLPLKVYIKLMM